MYIFGYGSLMNSASRKLTGETSTAIPVIVHGLIRHWAKIDPRYSHSPLAATVGDGQVNGVLLHVTQTSLDEFDTREVGYERIQIDSSQIETNYPITANEPIWVYVKREPQPPCEKSPILQTYIDTVLSGCLEVSEQFAEHFVRHTVGWQSPLINDRNEPQYSNYAGVSSVDISKIDALLDRI
jgi:cation transport regulator ChaC